MRSLAIQIIVLFSLVFLALCAEVAKPEEHASKPKPVSVCSVTGDPHYHTFDGKDFNMFGIGEGCLSNAKDFNMFGIGDYLLVSRKAEGGFSGLTVQTKTKKWGAGSANVALVVKVNGNSITIEAESKKITGNDKELTIVDQVSLLHGTVVKKVTDNVFRIIARDGSAIEARIGVEKFAYMDIHIYLRDTYKTKVSGLCGDFDGKADNDGTDEAGTAFAVKYADDLFSSKETGYANTDKPAAWKNAEERTRAIRLCRSIGAKGIDLINCVKDFKLTRDVASISAYRHLANDVASLKEWVLEQRAERETKSLKGECKSRLAKVLLIARKQKAVIEKLRAALKKTVKIARSAIAKKKVALNKPAEKKANKKGVTKA